LLLSFLSLLFFIKKREKEKKEELEVYQKLPKNEF